MGYTHYWKRVEKFDKERYGNVVKDFKKVMKYLSPFVELAGGSGEGKARIDNKGIWFNGVSNCGHADRNLGITWPEKDASGIAYVVDRFEEIPAETLITLLCGQQEEL